MARKQTAITYNPKTKVKRRGKAHPFNHTKNLSKRSPFFGQLKRKRGQG